MLQEKKKSKRGPRSKLARPSPNKLFRRDDRPGKITPQGVVKEKISVLPTKASLVYRAKYLTADVRSLLGIRLMRSEAWFPSHDTRVSLRVIPFILNGHITSQPLGYWHCTSSQFFATITRAIFNKLQKRVYSSDKSKNRKKISPDLLARISIFYSSTLDDSKLERLLKCHPKKCRALLFHYICEMDEQKRFLYGQMLSSILWLQSRGKPRAKSIQKSFIPKYRTFQTGKFDVSGRIRRSLAAFGDQWIVRGPDSENSRHTLPKIQ